MKKLLKCEKYRNTFLASNETLIMVLTAILTNLCIEVWKVQKCDCGGWHIFVQKRSKKVKD